MRSSRRRLLQPSLSVLVRHAVVLAVMALALAGATAARAQTPAPRLDAALGTSRYDPALRFRTISTARFDIYFHQREEALAHRLAGFVEEVAAEVDDRLGAPRGRVHVILVDQTDQANGWATVFPYNLIELAAVPPTSQSTIGNTSDWLRLVFSHEYTHIVHLEKSRGWIGGLHHVFGRVPLLQPNVFLPQWQVEGLATYEESVSTGRGRVPAGDFRMILDQAAVHGRFASLDRAAGGVIDWPSGNSPYVYGAYFHQFLAERYGPASLTRLAEATAGTLPFFGSRAYRTVFGRSLGALWKDFEADTDSRIHSGAGTEPVQATRLTNHGFTVTAPTFSADGRIFYSLMNPHDFPALMELRPGTQVPHRVASRYLGEHIAVAGDHLVFSQLEVVRHTDLQSDLYAVPLGGGDAHRLTRDARAADADVAPDGHTIVCTVQQTGRRILALLELPRASDSGVPVPLVSEESTEFSAPRWSPDGRIIAAERRRLGGPSEIVLVDVATRAIRTLVSSEQGRNFGPVWLADGNTVLFSSDRGGTPFGIYGADVRTGTVRRLVGTGPSAQFPALSPDGHRLVFVGYTTDGYDLFSLPFDAPQWEDDPAPAVPPATSMSPAESGPAVSPVDAPYRPWSTLAPRYWVPVVASARDDVLIGASTSGFDALGRHAYVVTGTWAVPRNVPNWQADYSYSRWWPALFVGASDSTDDWRSGEVRSLEVTAGVLLPVRRVRSTTAALAAFQLSHDDFDCPSCEPPAGGTATLAATQFGWSFSSAKAFGYSISPEQGASAALTTELRRSGEGGNGTAGAATVDVRGYTRVLPRHGVVAVRAAGATTWGNRRIRRVFDAGGSGSQPLGFDFGSRAINLLRGFGSTDLYGFHAAVVNVDYRFPLGWPQRGFGTMPVMVRNLHGAVFFDAGDAWDTSFHAGEFRRSVGVELSSDTLLADVFPLSITGGAAWRHDRAGRDAGWAVFARVGRAF
jgi:hypothetical protein